MRTPVVVVCLALTAVACDLTVPTGAASEFCAASGYHAAASTGRSSRDISVGEAVEGIYGDGKTINPGQHAFWITPSQTGTLRVTLAWNPYDAGTLLKLTLNDVVFNPQEESGWSPVVGIFSVEAGKRSLIIVSLAGADWLPEDRCTLTTRMDP